MIDVALNALGYVFVFLLMAVPGYVLRRMGKISDEGSSCISFVLSWVAQPLLVLGTFVNKVFESERIVDIGICIAVSLAATALALLISMLAYRLLYSKESSIRRNAYAVSATFMNCGFIGIPLIGFLMPGDSMATVYAAMFVAVFNAMFWTVGVYALTGNRSFVSLRNLLNPTFIAIFVGLALFFSRLSDDIPVWLGNGINMLGGMATPLCMIVLGVSIADTGMMTLFKGSKVWLAVLLKLLISPLAAIGVMLLIGCDPTIFRVVVLLSAMPTASLSLVLAKLYGGDAEGCLKVLLCTTVMCVFTVPLMWGFAEYLITL